MTLIDVEEQRQSNPVDVIEQIAALNDWAFERAGDDEISISIEGGWAEYQVSFSWMEEREAIHLACAFDLKVPERAEARSDAPSVFGQRAALDRPFRPVEQGGHGHVPAGSPPLRRRRTEQQPGRTPAGHRDRSLRALLPGVPVRRLGRKDGAGGDWKACCSRPSARHRARAASRRPSNDTPFPWSL